MFNSRWINSTNQNYELEQIVETFERNNFYVETGREFDELNHKIECSEIINHDNINFIYGKFGFQFEFIDNTPLITREKIRDGDGEPRLVSHVLNFWIGDNQKFLFSSSKPNDVKGRNKLSQILFNNDSLISKVSFGLEEIARAAYQGEFGNMWLTGFEDRNGGVQKGIIYGNNVIDDEMYAQIIDSIKNQLGVTHEIDNEEVKIRLTRTGTIQPLTRKFENDEPHIFNLVNELNEYIII
ncbi:hypothetical protein KQY27_03210 [Methanobrevibacter sp. TMH8]|uniref:hypothetical protein n=1 Tax=Methanobrevibacter sp. TMH8 TaxID=2848611 RepID=UPI001CCA38BB|nr:hypothetical protein [Methanobrevibacter sp. TMH8]MBZ9570553.1 hypothetical protein [Methanobrevibacter sp. TMH8]